MEIDIQEGFMKKWFLEHFLPMWAKETVLRDNRTLYRKNKQLREEIARQQAYIRGLEMGLRGILKNRRLLRQCEHWLAMTKNKEEV